MPFQKLCVGFKLDQNVRHMAIPYTASSLFDVIGNNVELNFTSPSDTPKNKWMELIAGSSMQKNCNQQGFNLKKLLRLGFSANNENDCQSCDSFIGFGFATKLTLSAGNKCRVFCSNKDKIVPAFGYIMIQ